MIKQTDNKIKKIYDLDSARHLNTIPKFLYTLKLCYSFIISNYKKLLYTTYKTVAEEVLEYL